MLGRATLTAVASIWITKKPTHTARSDRRPPRGPASVLLAAGVSLVERDITYSLTRGQ